MSVLSVSPICSGTFRENFTQEKTKIMGDLLEFQKLRVDALNDELSKVRKEVGELELYLMEVTDDDCPDDYKRVIRSLIKQK